MNILFSTTPWWRENWLALLRMVVGFFMIYHGFEVFDAEKMKVYLEWEPEKNIHYTNLCYGKL